MHKQTVQMQTTMELTISTIIAGPSRRVARFMMEPTRSSRSIAGHENVRQTEVQVRYEGNGCEEREEVDHHFDASYKEKVTKFKVDQRLQYQHQSDDENQLNKDNDVPNAVLCFWLNSRNASILLNSSTSCQAYSRYL
ncbi:hypothetical protein TYRP_019944 [Tyrophagus putrescentiae]|nr:hypothetical protein TYRP_019944 [Tyrophagus putrescentiae]